MYAYSFKIGVFFSEFLFKSFYKNWKIPNFLGILFLLCITPKHVNQISDTFLVLEYVWNVTSFN